MKTAMARCLMRRVQRAGEYNPKVLPDEIRGLGQYWDRIQGLDSAAYANIVEKHGYVTLPEPTGRPRDITAIVTPDIAAAQLVVQTPTVYIDGDRESEHLDLRGGARRITVAFAQRCWQPIADFFEFRELWRKRFLFWFFRLPT